MALSKWLRRRKPSNDSDRANAPNWPATLTLESSFACNLACRMCPRACGDFQSDSGHASAHLQPEVFDRVAPFFQRFGHVHLSVWGEPLVNPHIYDYMARLGEAGVDFSLATNATLLTEQAARRMLECDIEHINVSCDAASPKAYRAVRGQDLFDRVVGHIQGFARLRDQFRRRAQIHWVFVLMRSNLSQLPGAVEIAGRSGADVFVVKHMETAVAPEDLSEALFNTGRTPDLTPEDRASLEETIDRARRAAQPFPQMRMVVHPQVDAAETTCLLHPLDLVIVDHEGNVSPCCYTMPVLTRPYQAEKPQERRVLVAGNVRHTPLDEILASPAYRRFAERWRRGVLPDVCQGCLLLARRLPMKN